TKAKTTKAKKFSRSKCLKRFVGKSSFEYKMKNHAGGIPFTYRPVSVNEPRENVNELPKIKDVEEFTLLSGLSKMR
ncbi:hypothetical protein PMAYCL1PPCAC_19565, partial [Pristionchus mayeri]